MPLERLAERERRMALARKLYCDTTAPINVIAAQVQVTPSTIGEWARRQEWPARNNMRALKIGEGRWLGKTCPGLALCPERKIEIARAWSAASKQIEEIEKRQAALTGQGNREGGESAERVAKAFALVVRTMRELAAIEEARPVSRRGPARRGAVNAAAGGKAGAAADGSGDDQDYPRDVDGLRQAIAHQLDGLRRGRAAAAIPGKGAGGGPAAPET